MRLLPILLITVLFLSSCAQRDDKAQIAEHIATIQEAVEQKQFSTIENYLHPSFVANERMGIDEVRKLLRLHGLRHKKLNVTIIGSSTTMHANFSDRADSVVSVITTGSSGFLPSDGSVRRVDIEWVKDSGQWLIRKAAWRH